MEEIHQRIREFFEEYERKFAEALAGEPDTETITGFFADFFVEASPVGVSGGKNDEALKDSIRKGYDFYRSIWTTAMKVRQVSIRDLDALHYEAKIHWEAFYKKGGNSISIPFTVIYYLQFRNNWLKIFAYITGDEQKVLKESGLI